MQPSKNIESGEGREGADGYWREARKLTSTYFESLAQGTMLSSSLSLSSVIRNFKIYYITMEFLIYQAELYSGQAWML